MYGYNYAYFLFKFISTFFIVKRRTILDITQDVIKILKKEEELSVRAISKKTNSQWRTVLKTLEFLKEINLVYETRGKKLNKNERIFSLVDKKEKYGK
jgi:predicted transcriptional regulator